MMPDLRRTSGSRRPSVLLLAVTAAAAAAIGALSGCGDEPAGASTSLEVVVRPDGEGPAAPRAVECGGERDRAACERLREMTVEDFRPVPSDAVCTKIYGGPATATVTGTLRGEPLRATFDRRDGCAIDRWQRFEWLIGRAP